MGFRISSYVMYDQRNETFLKILNKTLWPFLKFYFRLSVAGLENIPSEKILIVSNHNIGALVESHSLLFLMNERHPKKVFGFTHPFIFKIPLCKEYFEAIGAVPATYEVAKEVFANDESLLIFPGGNRQAVRSIWDYKQNHFRWSHGWAKIALEHDVKVLPVTYKNSHFVNPVFVCSRILANILVIPRLLGVKWLPVSLSQILFTALTVLVLKAFALPWYLVALFGFLVFHATVLIPLLPVRVKVQIFPAIKASEKGWTQAQLEEHVAQIMDQIYT